MQEHEKIPYDSLAFQEYWGEGLRLPGQSKGLDRWFFQWQWRNSPIIDDEQDSDRPIVTESGYYASYVIGAQWFDEAKTMPLVITTKHGCDRIDFLKMFSVCFNSGIEAKEFSKIYAVDMEQPRIKAPELKSVLSPLIVAHFLSIVKEIVKRGLKKDYVHREDNLKKVKGRIAIFRNERTNIQKKRYDKVFCQYQEYSEETVENRLIKKAYHLLNLQTFITAGEMEVKAWTYHKGWKAPQCAGVIHTDFEKGFIRAEVIKYEDYLKYGSEAAVREAGKLGIEGKDYEVQDGDIMHFRFNV